MEAGRVYHFVINEDQDVIGAIAETQLFAKEIGFNLIMQTMIATTISELGSNIVKYAGRGQITVGLIRQMKELGIEIIAEDHGPGISDRAKALSDKFSTGDSL